MPTATGLPRQAARSPAQTPARPGATASSLSRYALLVRVPPQISQDLAERVHQVPGVTIPPLGYHVTVYGPFAFVGDPAQGRALLRAIVQSAGPFTIRLQGIGVFRSPGANAVYLHADGGRPLAELRARLVQALAERAPIVPPQGSGYTPHVTLGLNIADADLTATVRRLRARRLAYSFPVRELWLLQETPTPPSTWLPAERYLLGEGEGG